MPPVVAALSRMGGRGNFTTKGGSNFTTRCLLLFAVLQVAAALSPLKCEDRTPKKCEEKQKKNNLRCDKLEVQANCMRTCGPEHGGCGPPPPIKPCTNKKRDEWCDKKLQTQTKARDKCKDGKQKSLLKKCTKTCGNLIGGSLVGAQMGCSFPKPPDCRICDSDEGTVMCTGGQVWTSCTAHCQGTCAVPRPMCTKICKDGCKCPPEKPLLEKGVCIAEDECPARGGNDCTGGQEWNRCGSPCVKTCADPEPMWAYCFNKACNARCQCPPEKPLLEGGKCIADSDCPAGAGAKPAKRSSLFASMKREPGITDDPIHVSTTTESVQDTRLDDLPCC